MNTLSLLVSPVGLAAVPTVTKSVGSFFRYNVDYKNAPAEDRRNEFKREASLLGLAFASNLAVQLLAAKSLPKILKAALPAVKDPATMQAASLLARFALTIPGTIVAEGLSRVVGKPPNWNHNASQPASTGEVEHDDDDDDRNEAKRSALAGVSSFETPQAVFNPFATTRVPMAGISTPIPAAAPALNTPLVYHSRQSAPFSGHTPNPFAPRNF